MLNVDPQRGERSSNDGGSHDETEKAEGGESTENTDEKKQVVEFGAIAEKQRTNDVVGDTGDAAADGKDDDSFAPMALNSKPHSSGKPDDGGTDNGDDGTEGDEHSEEDGPANTRDLKGDTGEGALDGGNEESHSNAGKDEIAGLLEHVFADFGVEGNQGANSAKNSFAIAEHKEKSEEQDDQIDDEGEKVFEEGSETGSKKGGDFFGALTKCADEIELPQGFGKMNA